MFRTDKYSRNTKITKEQIVDIYFNTAYYQELYILIIEYSNVVTLAEW
jgi:hypothetical protein